MLEVRDLTISFKSDVGDTAAVRSVSFSVQKGETLAIVGESGSGKSVTAMALTRLLPEPPAHYESGVILLDGQSILKMNFWPGFKTAGSSTRIIVLLMV